MRDFLKKVAKVLALCVFTIVSFYAVQFLLAFFFRIALPEQILASTITNTIYTALTYLLVLLIVIFIPKKLLKEETSKNELGIIGLPTWTDLGLAPIGFIAYFVIASVLVSLFQAIFPWFDPNEAQDVGFDNLLFGFDRIIALVALVIIAPTAEEIIFRGWLYAKIKKTIKKKTKKSKKNAELLAIILSTLTVSIVFGFLHGQWNVAVNVFALSLILCALREITGTIYSGIILHMIKNAVAFYLLYIIGIA